MTNNTPTTRIITGDFLNNNLHEHSFDVAIIDPPYYKVRGEFDYKWETFADYMLDVAKWRDEVKRLLKPSGCLFWFGFHNTIAHIQVALEKEFAMLNHLVWVKPLGAYRNPHKDERLRSFPMHTERILFMAASESRTGTDEVRENVDNFRELKKMLDDWHDKTGLTLKEITDILGSSASHYFGFSKRPKRQFYIPTREKFEEMEKILPLPITYEELKQQYDKKWAEYTGQIEAYNSQRRHFTNYGTTEIIQVPYNVAREIVAIPHPTPKPLSLIEVLLKPVSIPGMRVLVPFVGSGSECIVANRLGLDAVGYEIDSKYADYARRRVKEETAQMCINFAD